VPSIRKLKPELPARFDAVFERALAKEAAARYPSAAEFVAELRAALHDDAGTTGWIMPASATSTAITQISRPAPSRGGLAQNGRQGHASSPRRWLLAVLLALLLGGGIAAAFAATRHAQSRAVPPKRKPVTILRTVTQPGTTVEQTVTAPAPPPATLTSTVAEPATTAAVGNPSGTALNAAGYANMQAGDYRAALPLLQQAVEHLTGTGTLAEAYADYNLAYTRYELGQCTSVMSLLDHSQSIQGRRTEIDALRRDARQACG
jgi:tetratricopeptide (TPR) repeat protein